jgi:hypothetical protein
MLKIVTSLLCVILLVDVVYAQQASQKTENYGILNGNTMITTNQCFPKGGIGIINKSLYIVVKSAKDSRNELVVKPTEETESRWKGRSVAKAEVVIFYEGKVWSVEHVPDDFDLSRAVVISFESDKVRFFDFQAMFGGYYERSNVP